MMFDFKKVSLIKKKSPIKKLLTFAKKHENSSNEHLKKYYFQMNRRSNVSEWDINVQERYDERHVIPTNKHGGEKFMRGRYFLENLSDYWINSNQQQYEWFYVYG